MSTLLSVYQQRSALLAVSLTALLSLQTQAALPESIQIALSKAALNPSDISIIVSPVGDKITSRLPPIVVVIDKDNADERIDKDTNKSTNNNNKAITISVSSNDININTQKINSKDNTVNNSAKNKAQNNPANAPIIVNKQAIEQRKRALDSYTDDLYTHQSLQNIPSVVVSTSIKSAINNSTDLNKTADNDTADNVTSAVIPITNINTVAMPLLSHNPTTTRTPASTMKLIPSFIALDTLGADFVWFTRVYYSGRLIGNRLHGDLIIQGSGDPKMTHERLKQLLYQVQKVGIWHIEGDIIIDSAIFNNVSKDPAAFDNEPLRPYNASPDGFLVNFNSMSIASYPLDNQRAQLTYTPQLANYELPKSIDTRPSACSSASYSLAPQWHSDKLSFGANIPDSCGEHVFYVAYPDAKDFAARVVEAKWQALGNTLSGKVISQEAPYNAANNDYKPPLLSNSEQVRSKRPYRQISLPLSLLPIVSYPSLNLTQQIYDINHFSNNVMTEQVALSIGAYNKNKLTNTDQTTVSDSLVNKVALNKPVINHSTSLYQFDKSKTSDYPQALQTIDDWWQTHLQTPSPHLTNGSGLCRECTVTAANLSELLTYAYSHPSFDAYVDSLGVAGVSGTIAYHSKRLPDSAAIGRAWIKTGTLNNVTAMAGYVKGKSGQDYTVVGLINTDQAIHADTARLVLDAMLDWSAQQ